MKSGTPRITLSLLPALALSLLFSASAWGGMFSVSPVRIYMAPKDRAMAVTLTNEGENEVVLQAELFRWEQTTEGVDNLTPTDDLLLSPPIIKLAPKARQVVRLAMLAPRDPSRQMTYRMVLHEVPEAVPHKNRIQVPIALALNLPVFITPPMTKREVACEVKQLDDKKLQAVCSNTGTVYAQIRELVLRRDGKQLGRFEGGNYILPGARKSIDLPLSGTVPAGPAELQATYDDNSSQTYSVTLH